MHRLAIPALALVSVPALASLPTVDEIALAPSEGLALITTFDETMEMSVTEMAMTLTVDGEELEQELPDIEMTQRQSTHIVWSDAFETVEDGLTSELKRTYDEISRESETAFTNQEGDEEKSTDNGQSELEGVTVVFQWEPDEEIYEAHCEDAEVDEDLLAELEFDAYLTGLLPPDDVSEGDEWQIDIEVFNRLGNPGGDPAIVMNDEEDDDNDTNEQLEENLEGTMRGEYAGLREVDGVTLAEILISAELETYFEQDGDLPYEGVEGTMLSEARFVFDLEGTLLWNIQAGHPVSFEIAGDIVVNTEREMTYEAPQAGEIISVEERTLEGTLKFKTTFE
jgi:hypothetical protein